MTTAQLLAERKANEEIMNVQISNNKLALQQMAIRQQVWDDQREILRVDNARAAEAEEMKRRRDNSEFLANQKARLSA